MQPIQSIFKTLYVLPFRAWQYGQRRPYEAIVYGLTLGVFAIVAKLVLALLACLVVGSGVKKIFEAPVT